MVGTDSRVVVRFGPDGDSLDADVLGVDASSDLAVAQHRPRRGPAGRQAARVRRLAQRAGRRPGDRDRQPVRARPHRHRGDRLRARPRDPGAQRLLDRRRSSRPTPRSTPATPAARCSTTPASVIGVNSQIATAGGGRATSASASPSPRTPCARSCPGSSAARRSSAPYLGLSDAARRPERRRGRARSSPSTPGGPADEGGPAGRATSSRRSLGAAVADPTDVASGDRGPAAGRQDRRRDRPRRAHRDAPRQARQPAAAHAVTFAAPLVLLALLALPLLAVWLRRPAAQPPRRRRRVRHPGAAADGRARGAPAGGATLPMLAFALAIAVLIVAAAQPQKHGRRARRARVDHARRPTSARR